MTALNFMFLQGLRSPFFKRLAHALTTHGHRVTKVHYTVGDHLYWPLTRNPKTSSTRRCKASAEALPDFYGHLFSEGATTDLVLFGDCRPVHRPAIELAKRLGLNVHVFEEGYFRPNWVTLERNGVNGYSDLPRDPAWYCSVAPTLPSESATASSINSMPARIFHDVAYNLAGAFNPLFYPHYESHVPHSIVAEYRAYISRYARVQQRKHHDHEQIKKLTQAHHPPFFLVPLQVPGDAQLLFHAGGFLSEGTAGTEPENFIQSVITSFLKNAPANSVLVFKNHPLDPGLARHDKIVANVAQAMAADSRIRFLETGHLPTLLEHAAGLVAINSTTIGQALFHRCPTMVLGHSMFNMPGLSFQGSLDEFWCEGKRPDAALFKAFKRVVLYATQINGGLYSHHAINLAVDQALTHLLAPVSRLQALLAAHPPTGTEPS